jgi:BirA family biotin operon repressor/biotin-[acetyl-CoA-carboxylase] ligase
MNDILSYVDKAYIENVLLFDSLESTNNTAKEYISLGYSHGTFIIANEQTAGKGRLGRSFYSPKDTGIYLSVILDVNYLPNNDFTHLTANCALLVSKTIDLVTQKTSYIKWVNDILIDNKKVCGILLESVFDSSNYVSHIVAGIGVNVSTIVFPSDITNKATSLLNNNRKNEVKNMMIGFLINTISSSDDWLIDPNNHTNYVNRSIVINKNVDVIMPNETFKAFITGIDDDYRLIIKKESGEVITLYGGEISIRLE